MKPISLQGFLCSIILIIFSGCKDKETPTQPIAGEKTLNVAVVTYDEFEQSVPTTGRTLITLAGDDRVWQETIPAGSSSCKFYGLPSKGYILYAWKDGFYPYETVADMRLGFNSRSIEMNLYPLPSPETRIDTIDCYYNSTSSYLIVRLVAHQTAPSSFWREAAIFLSQSPNMNPSKGLYDYDFQIGQWGEGNVMYGTVYNYLREPRGTQLYVTARLMTGATKTFYKDSSWNNRIYSNLEENTKVVDSFILQ